jgi:uncharacterized protein YdeI (YjbR/CyaY-like superfamily)
MFLHGVFVDILPKSWLYLGAQSGSQRLTRKVPVNLPLCTALDAASILKQPQLLRNPRMLDKPKTELPIIAFASQKAWDKWLKPNHLTSPGIWIQLAKKASDTPSVTYAEAIEIALCYGWIDGQKQSHSTEAWLQKFTPRGRKSIWSKINREKAFALIECGKMQPAGLAEVERAKQDGRWEQAYDSPGNATVPADLQAALNESPRAKAFFATLESRNRYAILWRVQTAKKTETRSKRIALFIGMLERGEKLHP